MSEFAVREVHFKADRFAKRESTVYMVDEDGSAIAQTADNQVAERIMAALAATDDARLYRTALLEIRVREGRVCEMYEICEHASCDSSYAAWAIADSVLGGMNHDEMAAELAAAAQPAPAAQADGREEPTP